MVARRVVGIDIDNGMIRTVQLKEGSRKRLRVEEFLEFEIPRGLDDAGRITDVSSLAAALRQLWLTANYQTKDVALGMGNVQVFVREFVIPAMPESEIKAALPLLSEGVLPLPAADLIMDFYPFTLNEVDGQSMMHGLLVAALASSVENLVLAVEQAGLNPISVDLIPFALARFLLETDKSSGVCMLVHIASRIINIVITVEGIPRFIRIIPIANVLGQIGVADSDPSAESTYSTAPIPDSVIAATTSLPPGTPVSAPVPAAPPTTETGPLDLRTSKILQNPDSRQEIMRGLRETASYYNHSHPDQLITTIKLAGFGLNQVDFSSELAEVSGLPVIPLLKSPLGHAAGSSSKAGDYETPDELTVALALARGAFA